MNKLREPLGDNPVAFKALGLHLKSSHRILKTCPTRGFYTSDIRPPSGCGHAYPLFLTLLSIREMSMPFRRRDRVGGMRDSYVWWFGSYLEAFLRLAPSGPSQQLPKR